MSELRLDFEFWVSYISTVVERYLLPNRDEDFDRTYFCNAILDLLDNYERNRMADAFGTPRKDLGSVQDQLAFDFNSTEVQ